jgi:DNA-binding phage protein
MKTRDYREDLLRRLKNKRYAAKLLQCSFEESCHDGNWEAFGIVLKDVIAAMGNTQEFAKSAKISRANLYKLFGKKANPTLETLLPILGNLGLTLQIAEDSKG